MKKVVFAIMTIMSILTSFAQLNGDGYYRVQNAMTKRYAYVTDDKGSVNLSSTSADLLAIALWQDFNKAASDPSTVFYIKSEGSQYDMTAQGTGVHAIIGYYFNIRTNTDGTYFAYASLSGAAKYLGDNEYSSAAKGNLSSEGKGDYRKWYIKPIKDDDEYYFGFLPTISDATSNYLSFYADFGYIPSSTKIKSYYVSTVDKDMAVLKEITTAAIPASTPVLVKCESTNVTDNKVTPTKQTVSQPANNLLTGVYFNNTSVTHNNQVAYNPTTMRILGKLTDGSVGFVKSDIKFIPANTAYLNVSADTPDELRLVSETEYVAGVETIQTGTTATSHAVYSLSGMKVAQSDAHLSALPAGIYVVGGKKVVVQ